MVLCCHIMISTNQFAAGDRFDLHRSEKKRRHSQCK